jgi:hypothetical protein
VSPEDQEELAYLNEVLTVLLDSLAREQQTDKQEKLQEYIRDIRSRIAALGSSGESRLASGKFASSNRGQPTFLNLDAPYPDQIFTILIWGSERSKFGTPERDYAGKSLCVTGLIQDYRGTPEIVVRSPAQISEK